MITKTEVLTWSIIQEFNQVIFLFTIRDLVLYVSV